MKNVENDCISCELFYHAIQDPATLEWYPIYPLEWMLVCNPLSTGNCGIGGGGGPAPGSTVYISTVGSGGNGGWTTSFPTGGGWLPTTGGYNNPWPGGGTGGSSNNNTTPNMCARGWLRYFAGQCEPDNQTISLQSITNNVTNPCLLDVYNMIGNIEYKNRLTQMLNTFAESETINITFEQVTTLPSDVYGNIVNTSNGDDYTIQFNNNILPRCSKEVIATVYFHEVIHAYLKSHQSEFDWDNNNEHNLMLQHFFGQLSNAVRELFPNLSEKHAWCICFESIVNSVHYGPVSQVVLNKMREIYLQKIALRYNDLNSEAAVLAIANTYAEGGTAGTRDLNCQ